MLAERCRYFWTMGILSTAMQTLVKYQRNNEQRSILALEQHATISCIVKAYLAYYSHNCWILKCYTVHNHDLENGPRLIRHRDNSSHLPELSTTSQANSSPSQVKQSLQDSSSNTREGTSHLVSMSYLNHGQCAFFSCSREGTACNRFL